MNVRNCRKCGRIFNYVVGLPICQSCKEAMEKKFQEVKEYIRENKDATIPMISEACQVETSQIHQWIREERLEFAEDSPLGVNCESCGAMIKSGRYCDKCKITMTAEFKNAVNSSKKTVENRKIDTKDNPKMRFLDRG